MNMTIWFLAATCLASVPADDKACCEAGKTTQVAASACCGQECKQTCTIRERLFGCRKEKCQSCDKCGNKGCDKCCNKPCDNCGNKGCDKCCNKPCNKGCDKDCAWHGTLICRQPCPKPACKPCPCKTTVACTPCCEPAPRVTSVPGPLPAATGSVSEINPNYLHRLAKAEDYTWVTGQLYYIHADGGLWVVRYAPVDSEDRYGGSVVLTAAINMRDYREGDLITVRGEVLNEGRASKFLGGPLYRVNSLEMIARSGN
jgi:hypothetical protein